MEPLEIDNVRSERFVSDSDELRFYDRTERFVSDSDELRFYDEDGNLL